MISSTNNEKVKYLKKLRNTKYSLEEKKFIVETEHLVLEAINAHKALYLIALENYEIITNLEIIRVSENVMKSISNLKSIPKVCAVCKLENKEIIGDKIIILDGVSDPGNIGTIIRTSVAFNIDTIIFSDSSVNIFNDKLIRASEGMYFKVNLIKSDLKKYIKIIKEKDIKVIGTTLENAKELKELNKYESYALILGNEGSGIRKEILETCDELVTINMNNECESLNVGVSCGIILYNLEN